MRQASATQNKHSYQSEPSWSRSEKAIARQLFDTALKRELHDIVQAAKQKATQIKVRLSFFSADASVWDALVGSVRKNYEAYEATK